MNIMVLKINIIDLYNKDQKVHKENQLILLLLF